MGKAHRLRQTLERRDSLLNLQTDIRRVLHDKNHEQHRKRDDYKSIHLQHTHKPLSTEAPKTEKIDSHPKTLRVSPQSNIFLFWLGWKEHKIFTHVLF